MSQVGQGLQGHRVSKDHQACKGFQEALVSQEDQEKEVYQVRKERKAIQVLEHKDPEAHQDPQDLQEKVGLAARDHQDLQAHEVLLVTWGPRAQRVLLGLQGTVTHPPALATAWEVSSEELGQLPFAEVWVALSNSPSEMEATNETCTKMWWLPKNLCVRCGSTLWDCSMKRR